MKKLALLILALALCANCLCAAAEDGTVVTDMPVAGLKMVWPKALTETKGTVVADGASDLGGGIYMPISSSSRLVLPTIPADSLPRMIAEAEKKLKGENNLNKTEQKMAEKLIKQLKQHEGHDVRMELFFAYDIKYRYFKVK